MQAASQGIKSLRKYKGGKQETQNVKDVDNLKSATPLEEVNGVEQTKSVDNM